MNTPGERIDIASVPNLRDLGGYGTATGGRVRMGRLYRSVELNHLEGADLDTFASLGIRTVFDFRTEPERQAQPDVVPEGTEQVVCDVLADEQMAAPAQLLQLLSDPTAAQNLLGDGRATTLFDTTYRDIVSLPSALAAYRRFFTSIAVADHLPALFHCTTGKDRTGWGAAATLLLCGVDRSDVFFDYELTNRDLIPALKPVFEQVRAAGGDPELLKPVLGVDRAYLETALDEVDQRFGSIEGYFADGLGIDTKAQRSLAEALTEGP